MLAVFVNMAAVIIGSLLGIFFRKKIKPEYFNTVVSALALITMSLGIASAIKTENMLVIVICLVIGTIIGTLLKINSRIEGAGDYIKQKLFKSESKESRFTEGFVTASIMFCVGSMAIMGSLDAGISHEYGTIFTKSALDFVMAIAFGAAMGVGVTFSALFVLVYQGALTLLSGLIAPYLSASVVLEMSSVGGILLIGTGLNMLALSDKKIIVADMMPAIFLPLLYFPIANLISGVLS